jgi:hypothetical protein
MVDQRESVAWRSQPRASHQPGNRRIGIPPREVLLIEAGVDQHARQGARRDPQLVRLSSPRSWSACRVKAS